MQQEQEQQAQMVHVQMELMNFYATALNDDENSLLTEKVEKLIVDMIKWPAVFDRQFVNVKCTMDVHDVMNGDEAEYKQEIKKALLQDFKRVQNQELMVYGSISTQREAICKERSVVFTKLIAQERIMDEATREMRNLEREESNFNYNLRMCDDAERRAQWCDDEFQRLPNDVPAADLE